MDLILIPNSNLFKIGPKNVISEVIQFGECSPPPPFNEIFRGNPLIGLKSKNAEYCVHDQLHIGNSA